MTHDLETRLRDSGRDLHLNRPVDDILGRGDRLRRRRTALATGGGALAVLAVIGGVAASGVLASGGAEDGNPDPAAVATTSRASETPKDRAAAPDLSQFAEDCLTTFPGAPSDARFPDGTAPNAAAAFPGSALALFAAKGESSLCVGAENEGRYLVSGMAGGDWDPLSPGQHLSKALGWGLETGEQDDEIVAVHTAVAISSDVDRVVAKIGGRTFEAAIDNGYALVRADGRFTDLELADASLVAYDAAGTELEKAPAQITGVDGAQDGTSTGASDGASGGAAGASIDTQLSEQCLTLIDTSGTKLTPGTPPTATAQQGSEVAALFVAGSDSVSCTGTVEGDRLNIQGVSSGNDWQALRAGEDLSANRSFDTPAEGMEGSAFTATQVSPRVASAVARVGGRDFEAQIDNGYALFLIDPSIKRSELNGLTFLAYDADGNELQRVGPAN